MKIILKIICLTALLVSFVALINYHYLGQTSRIHEAVIRMPGEDRNRLSDFFEELVIEQYFGYTLFGSKPVSCASYFVRPPSNDILLEDKTGVTLRNGEKAWNLYKHQFVLKDFILKFHTNQLTRSICLINKSLFIAEVERNIEYFKEVLGPLASPVILLERLENEDIDLFSLLQNHDGLIGIAYGFGTQNSINFYRYSELDRLLYEPSLIPFEPYYEEKLLCQSPSQKLSLYANRQKSTQKHKVQQRCFPSIGFQSVLEEYNHLQLKLEGTYMTFPLRRFASPAFRADLSSDETKKILDSFNQTTSKLAEIYAEGDFLEITLERLTRAEYEKN